MYLTIDGDGNTVEHYDNPYEYRKRGYELMRTGGRKQLIYEGWLRGDLVRIMRR